MCRWFAYISREEPVLLSDVLITPANSISRQCSEHYLPHLLPHDGDKDLHRCPDKLIQMRNSLLNMDGLGIAVYTNAASSYIKGIEGSRPALYKSQSPPINDFNFRNLCENSQSHCVFAHIRASSGSVVAPVNCHPFVFGRHSFMHNGVVASFSEIRRDMSQLISHDNYAHVMGTTDSEHAAALYMTNLTQGGLKETWQDRYPLDEMLSALTKTIHQILALQLQILGEKAAPSSLNFCVTDGTKMIGTRFRNHKSEQPPSLYWSESAGRSLNSKYPGHPDHPFKVNDHATKSEHERYGKHTIIASEPTTYEKKQWHLIGRNCALTVDEFGTESEVPIAYDSIFNFTDPYCC